MFTGLIQAVGVLRDVEPSATGVRLGVEASLPEPALELGESISVSGVCLTLTRVSGGALWFEVVSETLARSTLHARGRGDRVNLERSVTPRTLMGGHIVQGHVDAIGVVRAVEADPADWRIEIEAPAGALDLVAPKGSIAVEGVSLTVAESRADSFVVALIPETLTRTTLGDLERGARVNLETDILARQVAHWLGRRGGRG